MRFRRFLLERVLPLLVAGVMLGVVLAVAAAIVTGWGTEQPSRAPDPSTTPVPTSSVAGPAVPVESPIQGVQPSAFCTRYGQLGYTEAGALYRCTQTQADQHLRWRPA